MDTSKFFGISNVKKLSSVQANNNFENASLKKPRVRRSFFTSPNFFKNRLKGFFRIGKKQFQKHQQGMLQSKPKIDFVPMKNNK